MQSVAPKDNEEKKKRLADMFADLDEWDMTQKDPYMARKSAVKRIK